MNLYGIISWYDESPSWLASSVASLAKIGVDHVIAVDGRYPHFHSELSGPSYSPPEQSEAVMLACDSMGMGLTLSKLPQPMLEPDKRQYCFRLVEAIATPMVDWCTIIDADELIWEGGIDVKRELATLESPIHCAAGRIATTIDPHGRPEPDNDVSDRTEENFQKLPIGMSFACLQTRYWRVMHDMSVPVNHYDFFATDDQGKRWNIRPGMGGEVIRGGRDACEIHTIDANQLILHRKNHRTYLRREAKKAYYTTRDELRLEKRVTT